MMNHGTITTCKLLRTDGHHKLSYGTDVIFMGILR